MKRIKINLAIVAMLFGVTAAFAFKAPAHQFTNPTWQYQGGAVTDPASYMEVSGNPTCGTSGNLCQIVAPEDPSNPGEPLINSSLASRISSKNTSDHDVFLQASN